MGSLIVGAREFIHEARRNRKMVGGGMRQVGVLAAAGIVSLTKMVDRLAEDHVNARRLMQGIAEIPGLVAEPVHTNIAYFRLAPETRVSELDVIRALGERNVWLLSLGPRRFRAVTHCWIDADDVEFALEAMREVMKNLTE